MFLVVSYSNFYACCGFYFISCYISLYPWCIWGNKIFVFVFLESVWSHWTIQKKAKFQHFMMKSPNGTFSALLALCAGYSPVTGEFPSQRPVTRSFGTFFDLNLIKRLSKQSWGCWFATPSCPLWRSCTFFSFRCVVRWCWLCVGWWLGWLGSRLIVTTSKMCVKTKTAWHTLARHSVTICKYHDDVMTRRRFLHHWPFVRGIY